MVATAVIAHESAVESEHSGEHLRRDIRAVSQDNVAGHASGCFHTESPGLKTTRVIREGTVYEARTRESGAV
jgi:hypothetical protein